MTREWPVSRLRRAARRWRMAYDLLCAREDARSLGLRTPDGVWACRPCRAVFLTDFAYVVHAHS